MTARPSCATPEERRTATFRRSDKMRNTPGVGLGLNLAAAILRPHGFRLAIHPGPGGRLKISVRLPDRVAGELAAGGLPSVRAALSAENLFRVGDDMCLHRQHWKAGFNEGSGSHRSAMARRALALIFLDGRSRLLQRQRTAGGKAVVKMKPGAWDRTASIIARLPRYSCQAYRRPFQAFPR
jgi:hypothetical protein